MSTETTNKKIKIDNGTTFGKTYTDKAIDAKLPTDIIASANKLSLGVGNNALGNGVNLDGFTYDETTKTLKAEGSGATLPAGTKADPFIINANKILYADNESTPNIFFAKKYDSPKINFTLGSELEITHKNNSFSAPSIIMSSSNSNSGYVKFTINGDTNKNKFIDVVTSGDGIKYHIPALSNPTSDGLYYLQIAKNGNTYYYDWVAGGGSGLPTYNHYIVINDTTTANAIYLLITSTNNLKCNSLTDLDTLLGTAQRFIQASGVVTDTASKLPIVALNWQGSIATSKIITMSSEEATTKFTNVVDVVEPA